MTISFKQKVTPKQSEAEEAIDAVDQENLGTMMTMAVRPRRKNFQISTKCTKTVIVRRKILDGGVDLKMLQCVGR